MGTEKGQGSSCQIHQKAVDFMASLVHEMPQFIPQEPSQEQDRLDHAPSLVWPKPWATWAKVRVRVGVPQRRGEGPCQQETLGLMGYT